MAAGEQTRVDETRIKVFISYSRSDKAFASDLVLGLAACGFAPYIDRQDIAAGEDWSQRLTGLIRDADTIVYVVSPESVASEHCTDELREALGAAKRILPVVWRPVEDAKTPELLRRLNYIFFTGEGRTFAAGLADLAQALRTDIDWIREHTRLAGLAQRWAAQGRPATRLLQGDDIDTAQAWLSAKPIGGAAVTDEQADFIKASADARALAERRAQGAKQRALAIVSVVAVAMTGLAGASFWSWREADKQRAAAETQRGVAEAAKVQVVASEARTRTLSESMIRLNADIGLRMAPLGNRSFELNPGWYRAVSVYAGSVAAVLRSGGSMPDMVSTGALIDGGLIHSRFSGQPLLLAPAFWALQPQAMLRSDEAKSGEAKVVVWFPALDGEKRIAGAERIWRTPIELGGEFPFEIWRLSEAPPIGARAIAEADISCAPVQPTAGDALPIGQFSIGLPDERRGSKGETQLSIGELLESPDPQRQFYYTHSSNRASAGSPVLDFRSYKVLGLHIGSEPDPTRPGFRRGYGYSLPLALNIARSKLADEAFHPGPLCPS